MSESDHKRLASLLLAYFQADQHLNLVRFRECVSRFTEDEIFVKITSIEGQLGINSFNIAATRNHTDVLRAMLGLLKPSLQKELIFFQDFQRSFTVLHWAALKGFPQTFETLLGFLTPEQQQAVMKLKDNSGKTALYILADEGHVEAFKFVRGLFTLDSFCNLLKFPNEEHVSLLCQAVIKNNKNIVKTIVSSLSQTDLPYLLLHQDKSGNTAMHFAAMNGFSEIARLILESATPETRGKLLETRNSGVGESPLHIAVTKGHIETFLLMLRWIPNEDTFSVIALATIDTGQTLMHLAAKLQRVEMMRAVLNKIAAGHRYSLLKQKDNMDATALHCAVQTENAEIVNVLLEQLDAKDVRGLISRQDNVGNTALHRAVLNDSLETVECILNKLPAKYQMEALELPNHKANSALNLANGKVADFLSRLTSSNLDVRGKKVKSPTPVQKPIPARRYPTEERGTPELRMSQELVEEDNLPTEAQSFHPDLPTEVVGPIGECVAPLRATAQSLDVPTGKDAEVEVLKVTIRELERTLDKKNKKISDQEFTISELKRQVETFKDKSSRNQHVKKRLAEYLEKLNP